MVGTRSASTRRAVPRRASGLIFACVLLFGLTWLIGCGDGGTSPAPNFSGTYQGSQTNEATACSPQALPAPATQDPTQYVQFGSPGTGDLLLVVQHTGSQLTVSPELNEQGQPISKFDFTGTIAADGSFTVSRSLVIGLEGPREGGYLFQVVQQAAVSGTFVESGGQTQMDAAGTFTTAFREKSITSAVFTTCSSPFTSTTTRTGG